MFNKRITISADNDITLFIKMALKNIDFALISVDLILETYDIDYTIYKDDHTFYFYYIQNLLAACGNLANIFDNRIFFRHNSLYQESKVMSPYERSKALRRAIDLDLKEYPNIFRREARNTNMHFDERYDEFNRRIGDYNIIDEHTPCDERNEILTTPHLRTYDKQNQVYITFDRNGRRIVFPLDRLRQELMLLKDKLEKIEVLNDN